MTQKKVRVGLAWQTLSSSNLGVGALAWSQVELVRSAGRELGIEVELIEFCHSEVSGAQAKVAGVLLGDRLSLREVLTRRSGIIRQLKECDVVFDIGEGDSFSDIYGERRFLLLAAFKGLALVIGVPLVLSPQTIGPFNKAWVRHLAQILIRKATKVFARDHLSRECVEGFGAEVTEVIDVAFALPYSPRLNQHTTNEINIGVNVSGLLYNGGYTRSNQFKLVADYRAVVDRILAGFCGRPGINVHLIAHVITNENEVEDDYRVCESISGEYPGSILAPRFETPVEAKTYISRLDFFTGARMHACIAAFSSGVPVVPMAYSRKFNGLFQSLGFNRTADLVREQTDSVVNKILSGFDDRAQIFQEVRVGNQRASERISLYKAFLTSALQGKGSS